MDIKDTLLCQRTADSTGVRVAAGPTEATVIGNISAQLVALGEMKNTQEIRQTVKNSTAMKYYEPTDTNAWLEAYDRYATVLGKSAQ